jgi:hypothetical protein
MTLSAGEALALAQEFCCHCHGTGFTDLSAPQKQICACVWRRVFRACHERFRFCNANFVGRVSLDSSLATHRKSVYGLKASEFVSDFVVIARRTLTTSQYEIFKLHVLLGADWRTCTTSLGLKKGPFFHEVYRIYEHLGQAFTETKPHGLYPISNYFSYSAPADRRAA